MIDVGVADDQRIEFAGLERKRLGVAGFGLGTALDHAAVHQQAFAGGLDLVQRTGDFTGCAMEVNAHGSCLVLR